MAHIEKHTRDNGRVVFRARVSVTGYPKKTASFETMRDARAWASNIESDMRLGRYSDALVARQHTADAMIERYIKTVLPEKTDKPNTVARQRKQLAWWAGQLKDCKLANLTPYRINACKEQLAGVNYGTRSPATVNHYLAALNHVINTAIKEWGWMSTNPITRITRPKLPKGRARFLSDDERTALLTACALCKRQPLYLMVLFAIATGARKGEILSMRRKDVDLVRGMAVAYDTKNGENRTLYLSDTLSQLLAKHMQTRPMARLLFPSRGDQPLNIEIEWRRALKRAGIEDFRFHDLRHTSASYLAMNGASPSDIAEALGHKSYDMVKRYSHLSTTHVGNVVRSMNDKMLGRLPPHVKGLEPGPPMAAVP